MNTDRSVKVKDIVEKFQMEVLYSGADFETETLTITDVNRPGLQFVGFFDYFDPRRLQIIGKAAFAAAIVLIIGISMVGIQYTRFVSKTVYQESTSHLTEIFHQSNKA